jgi:cation transport ATPase
MSKWKNNLDEMQEQKLQRIESGGFWIAYWGLLAVMAFHLFRGGIEAGAAMLPEWALFMFLSVYIVVRCLRGGIWDRRLKANFKTNLIVSLIAGGAMFLFNTILFWKRFPDMPGGAVAGGAVAGIFTAVLCLVILSLCASLLKRKQRKLEEEPEEDDE